MFNDVLRDYNLKKPYFKSPIKGLLFFIKCVLRVIDPEEFKNHGPLTLRSIFLLLYAKILISYKFKEII